MPGAPGEASLRPPSYPNEVSKATPLLGATLRQGVSRPSGAAGVFKERVEGAGEAAVYAIDGFGVYGGQASLFSGRYARPE